MFVVLVVAMAALPLGCLSSTKDDAQILITASPQLQASAMPVLENTATATMQPTRKPTATFPPTRTPLPLQTDPPTIEPGTINAMLGSIYSMCDLPCWGNIIPGKTSQYAAKRLLSPLGEWYNPSTSSGDWGPLGEVSFQYNNSSASVYLFLKYGLVDIVNLPPVISKPYRINSLFAKYGKPEDVQIEILPLTAELTTRYWLVTLYPRQGFFAVFEAEGTIIDSIIHVCPKNVSPDLYLLASNTYSKDQMSEVVSSVYPRIGFQTLNDIADMNTDQFYEMLSKQSTNCIATKIVFQLP